jgi:hypothetical protein
MKRKRRRRGAKKSLGVRIKGGELASDENKR